MKASYYTIYCPCQLVLSTRLPRSSVKAWWHPTAFSRTPPSTLGLVCKRPCQCQRLSSLGVVCAPLCVLFGSIQLELLSFTGDCVEYVKSVGVKCSRHAGSDGGGVGQLLGSGTSSGLHTHLDPNWKDNTFSQYKFSDLRAASIAGRELGMRWVSCFFFASPSTCFFFFFLCICVFVHVSRFGTGTITKTGKDKQQ